MLRFLLQRLLFLPLVLLILITLSFFLMRAAPGDPFSDEKGRDPVIQANLEAKYHLDKHLVVQFGYYLGGLCQGDLGPSTKYKDRTVNDIVGPALIVSIHLGLTAMALALFFGVLSGAIAAIKQNTLFDYSTMSLAMIGISTPTFVVGPLLVLVFAFNLGWFRVSGWDTYWDMVLPSITLALPFMARISRLTRTGMLEIIHQEFIKTARAKGLSEQMVVIRHALRGAMVPVVSYLGPATAQIMTGSLVVEKIFVIQGLGFFFVDSAINRDYSLVLGLVVVFGTLLIIMNMIVDVLYAVLDPRVGHA